MRKASQSFACLVFLLTGWSANAEPEDFSPRPLTDSLNQLASQHGFEIKGLSLTQGTMRSPPHGPLQKQLKQLLRGFNYLIVQDSHGQVSQLTLLGVKPADNVPEEVTLPTEKQGKQHRIPVRISQNGLDWIDLEMVVDTGAEVVVLEESLIDQLGIDPASLQTRQIQTANGTAEARIGKLAHIELANERLEEIDVAFISNDRLDGHQLLGMSVLGQFKVTIDDVKNEVTLIRSR